MAIVAETEKTQIDERFAGGELARAVELLQQPLIGERRRVGIEPLRRHAMHMVERHRGAREHGLVHHAGIGVWMIMRHETFVAEHEMAAGPREEGEERLGREHLVASFRRRAPREGG
jgi:hypothetical protein